MTLRSRTRARVLPAAILLVAAACSGPGPFTGAAAEPPAGPRLAGRDVMVLPVQSQPGLSAQVAADVDAEIAFWAADAPGGQRWTFAPELDALVRREPALDLRARALAVAALLDEDRDRIGEPLLGDLRRLGAVAGRGLALVPARLRPAADTAAGLRLDLALVNTVGGAVLWRGRVEGAAAEGESAEAALARAFVRSFLE
jgi:hypothetical protein